MDCEPNSKHDENIEPCEECGTVIRYKADIPRHMKLHNPDKAKLMHHCPFEGCQYESLQKSNVTTHTRTHTGEKPLSCPDCEYATSDPASLTRHKKRLHEYQPKRAGANGKAPVVKKSVRSSPYSLERRMKSSSDLSVASQISEKSGHSTPYDSYLSTAAPSASSKLSLGEADAALGAAIDDLSSFGWEKDLEHLFGAQDPSYPVPGVPHMPSSVLDPRHLFHAADAGRSLEKEQKFLNALRASPCYLLLISVPPRDWETIFLFYADVLKVRRQSAQMASETPPAPAYTGEPHDPFVVQPATASATSLPPTSEPVDDSMAYGLLNSMTYQPSLAPVPTCVGEPEGPYTAHISTAPAPHDFSNISTPQGPQTSAPYEFFYHGSTNSDSNDCAAASDALPNTLPWSCPSLYNAQEFSHFSAPPNSHPAFSHSQGFPDFTNFA